MTAKAGQKCTAIRRILVPAEERAAVTEAIAARLAATVVGDPRREDTGMGALASLAQRADVAAKAAAIGREAKRVFGDPALLSLNGADAAVGAFMPPTLFVADDADAADAVHEVEAFGPVATVIGSRDLGHALALANRGKGALVASVSTHDPAVARRAVLEAGAWHGRLYFADRDSGKEATGHGSPLPHLSMADPAGPAAARSSAASAACSITCSAPPFRAAPI